MSASLRVVQPGIYTTVQDSGRHGYQHLGIPVSGALDPLAMRLANRIVGNRDGEAVLEILHHGPTLEVRADSVRVALVGGSAAMEIEGRAQRIPGGRSVRLTSGDQLRIAATGEAASAYLAVAGGFDLPGVLGSRSTYARGGFGGYRGRPLAAGDDLPLCSADAPETLEQLLGEPAPARPGRLRVIPGPQHDHFTAEAIAMLETADYTVSRASDRMGMRLDGPALDHKGRFNIVSDNIAPGAIQVPGDGLPIILLADRQTTGGYPKIATVISSDLPALGRLRPGDPLRFESVGLEDAADARRELADSFTRICAGIQTVEAQGPPDEDALRSENIIGGVVHATDAE